MDTLARWIWLADADTDVDAYVLLRRTFTLDVVSSGAVLHITVSQSFRLWVNGDFVGRGPIGSDPAWHHVDTIDLAARLHAGPNVLAVLAHNHGTSTHDLQAARGGFCCNLRLTTAHQSEMHMVSNREWLAKRSDRHERRAPRRFWSAGFVEIADLAADRDWLQPNFDDRAWSPAADLGPSTETWPWAALG